MVVLIKDSSLKCALSWLEKSSLRLLIKMKFNSFQLWTMTFAVGTLAAEKFKRAILKVLCLKAEDAFALSSPLPVCTVSDPLLID